MIDYLYIRNKLIDSIYGMDFLHVILTIIISIGTWSLMNAICAKTQQTSKIFRCFNICLFLGECIVILFLTIFFRGLEEREICLIPLYSFVIAKEESEIYRSMLMNVFLFVPYGLTLSYALGGETKTRLWRTAIIALIYSFMIELIQGIFGIGRAEVDDVICNTLGAVVGSGSCWINGKIVVKKVCEEI